MIGKPLSQPRIATLGPTEESSSTTTAFEHLKPLRSDASEGVVKLAAEGSQAGAVQTRNLQAFAVDSLKDGRTAFDSMILDEDGDPGNGFRVRVPTGGWAQLEVSSGTPKAGVWMKLLALDGATGAAKLYIGSISVGRGYPNDFVAGLEKQLGFYPGSPDYVAYGAKQIDDKTFIEQVERENGYLTEAAYLIRRQGDFDLLIFDLPIIDNLTHMFLLEHPRQQGFDDPERRSANRRIIEEGYRSADRKLGRVLGAGKAANLLITSDYALDPAHTRFDLNALLARAGFTVTGENPDAYILQSKTSAHLYLPRNQGLNTEQKTERLQRLAAALWGFRDPKTNEPIFDKILSIEEQRAANIYHPASSGDLWMLARPGYTLNARRTDTNVLEDVPFLPGEHGYLDEDGQRAGLLMAATEDNRPHRVSSIGSSAAVSLVSAMLGISPPCEVKADATQLKPILDALRLDPTSLANPAACPTRQ